MLVKAYLLGFCEQGCMAPADSERSARVFYHDVHRFSYVPFYLQQEDCTRTSVLLPVCFYLTSYQDTLNAAFKHFFEIFIASYSMCLRLVFNQGLQIRANSTLSMDLIRS